MKAITLIAVSIILLAIPVHMLKARVSANHTDTRQTATKYFILKSDAQVTNPSDNLAAKVNMYISRGYKPYGPPYVVFSQYGTHQMQQVQHYQAMCIGTFNP